MNTLTVISTNSNKIALSNQIHNMPISWARSLSLHHKSTFQNNREIKKNQNFIKIESIISKSSTKGYQLTDAIYIYHYSCQEHKDHRSNAQQDLFHPKFPTLIHQNSKSQTKRRKGNTFFSNFSS